MQGVYLRVTDVAKLTGRSAYTVRRWCRDGLIKAAKPSGKDYLIKQEDFEAFMDGGSNAEE